MSQAYYSERTFSIDPQKRSLLVPRSEDTSLEEPSSGSISMNLQSDIVVFRRIWRAEPILRVLLQLVPCISCKRRRSINGLITNVSSCLYHLPFVASYLSSWLAHITPICEYGKAYPESFGCHPLTLYHLSRQYLRRMSLAK